MKALPLIHFVRDNYNPHEKIEVIPSKVKWGDESLKLHSVRDAVLQNSGYILSSLSHMHAHIHTDRHAYIDMTCVYGVYVCNDCGSILCLCYNSYSLFEEHKEELIKLFSLDLYLVQDMIYVCPRDDLPLLCQYVPIGLVFGWLSDKLKSTNIQKLMKIEVRILAFNLTNIQSHWVSSDHFRGYLMHVEQ